MTIIEIGCMATKPNTDIMNDTTKECQILTTAWETVLSAPGGPRWIYWGLEVENPARLWGFFKWTSLDEHKKFAKSFGADAVKELPSILPHGIFTKHIAVRPSPERVLDAPVTGLMLVYFPPTTTSAQKSEIVVQFQH